MKVLIDECAPRALKTFLANQGYECATVQEADWAGKQNGELLDLAEADQVDVLVTVDTNLRYQQNLQRRRIAIVILEYSSNRLEHLRQHFPACASALKKIKPGEMFASARTAEAAAPRRPPVPNETRGGQKQIPRRRSRRCFGPAHRGQARDRVRDDRQAEQDRLQGRSGAAPLQITKKGTACRAPTH